MGLRARNRTKEGTDGKQGGEGKQRMWDEVASRGGDEILQEIRNKNVYGDEN